MNPKIASGYRFNDIGMHVVSHGALYNVIAWVSSSSSSSNPHSYSLPTFYFS
jgi:hypothetical protein